MSRVDCAVQVIGFGVAGLGVAVAADNQQQLNTLCDQGLVYIDKRTRGGFDSLSFDILSNSPASDFVAGMRQNGEFKTVFDSSVGGRLCDHQDNKVPLPLVSEFFKDTAEHLYKKLAVYPRSNFLADTSVATLRIEADGKITSLDADGKTLVSSKFAVVATGGVETPNAGMQALASELQADFTRSESILRGHNDEAILQYIKTGKQIVIMGGSHSAFSIVDYLTRHFSHVLQQQQILVVSRSLVKLNYDDMDEYQQSAQEGETCLVDAETQSINRYCGLRGDAKKVYQSVIAGEESTTKLVVCEQDKIKDLLANQPYPTGIVVQAIGYQVNLPTVVTHDGQSIQCKQLQGCSALSENYNLCTHASHSLERIFSVGLGSFVPSTLPYISTGEVPVGVNVYHKKDAAIIVEYILRQLDGSHSAVKQTSVEV